MSLQFCAAAATYQTAMRRNQRAQRVCRFLAFAALIFLLIPAIGHASGLSLYETGAPDLGTASAGRAAMAADASTAVTNPAGMTLLDRTQLLVAAGALLPAINFSRGSQTTTSGSNGGNAGVFFPIGSGFFVYKLSDRFRLGVGMYSGFGLSVDYSTRWAGRYYLTNSSIITGQFNPSIAYRVNDWLSVGAGFSIAVGRFFNEAKVNNVLPKLGDGNLEMESWSVEPNGNVGLLLRPIAKLKLGLTYQSPVNFTFGFNPHTSDLGPGLRAALRKTGLLGAKASLGMTIPQQMMSSVIYQLTPALALMGNIGWQNWSSFGQTTLGITSSTQRNLAVNLKFSDTIQIASGWQYRIGERWLWSAGFAYDSAPVSEANRPPSLPLDRQLRYGTGIQYVVNRDVTIGAANELMDASDAPFNVRRGPLAGRLQGNFSADYLDFLAFNLIWKFGPSD